jgi:hypothetical protein
MTRIIFVDDEVHVLQGMRRSMHAMRQQLSMVDPFAARRPATLGDLSRRFSCRSGEDRRGCIIIRNLGRSS